MANIFSNTHRRERRISYQLQALTHLDRAKAHHTSHVKEYCSSITSCLKSRLAWSDLELVRDVIFCFETQGWQKLLDEQSASEDQDSDPLDSLELIVRLGERFRVPLENAGVVIGKLTEEFLEMVLHATQLFHCLPWDTRLCGGGFSMHPML